MQPEQEFYETARAIVSFTDSYTQNKQKIEKEQSDSECTTSLTAIVSSLESLSYKIQNNDSCKSMIQIPKLLQSLFAISLYKIGTHIDVDRQRLEVRSWSRWCLSWIQQFGDEQVQTELVRQGYGRVMSISFCTAGGKGEEQDKEIWNVLRSIFWSLRDLYIGRNDWQPSFQPLPLLGRRSEEQIEEEGANEEMEAQMINNGLGRGIDNWANKAKEVIQNHFIHKRKI
ncbi:MAG: hypothetical protein EZS28_001545 [Streblomastix strix]|uniref:Uncharacterized protein n=1 Tax=Streblomastix strix TaxID=222440 RepID=A0A5J4X848_9EUKA|nr:MAG: hypothetical protein EZS28_001545 [Streblomastix strix]